LTPSPAGEGWSEENKNNSLYPPRQYFPKPLFSIIEPFVLRPGLKALSKHDRLDAVARNFSAHPSTSSGRTEKFHPIHIGKLLLTISLMRLVAGDAL